MTTARVQRFCPSCGGPVQAADRFCGACGGTLDPAAPAAMTGGAEAAADRRQVAVLFTDLSGFTGFSRQLDPEDVHALLERFYELVDQTVGRFGGTIDKHLGDGVMALFGAPVAHGNDEERAIRAALAVHGGLAVLGRELGMALACHIGIASGEVLASGVGSKRRRDYTVLGEAVNLAARLLGAAGPDETMIAEATYRAVSDLVEVEPVAGLALKGLKTPVSAYRVRAVAPAGARHRRGAMVGRRAELRQFGSLLKSTARAGRGGAVLVRGEAGLGKTRLVRVFARRARRAGFAAHVGHVLDFGASGGGALGELLLSLLRLAPDAPEEARRAAIEQAVARRRVREVDRLFLADLLDLPLGAELRTTFDAMTSAARLEGRTACLARLLRRSARRKPCLVVVEDVHWADRAKLESLASLARGARHAPYLLVMTTRPEGDPIDGAWRAATEGAALLTLDLAPLAVEEAQRLAARYLAADSAEARHCIGRAGGNPLFLEQLLLSARSGELERLPGSVQSVVLARVDRLGPPERRVIQAAAVLGQRFAPEVVAYLLDVPAISCEALVRANLLRPSAGEFSFAHALIWEGVYGALLKRRRYELHRRAAQWFATRDAVLHAEHLDRAEDAAAPAAYLAAARQQAEHYRHLAALDLIRRGLALATDALQRHQLHLLESELERELGRAKPALKAARQAHAAAGHGLERVRALIAIAEALRVRDRIAPALIRLDRAERLLGATEHPLERSRLHHLRGNLYFPLGRMGECLREHEKAMMQAKFAASIEGEVRALGGLGDALYALGRFKSAFEHFERCVAQAEAHGFGRIAVANRPMLPACASLLGRLEDNRRHGELAIQAAVRAGNRRAELVARTALSFGELDARAIDRVLKETAACLRLLKSVEAPRLHQEVLGLRSVALVRAKGRHLEATALAREAVARARRTGLSYFGPWLLAMLAFATEDAAERAAALAEGEALLAKGVLSHNLVGYYGLAIEIGIETNALDEAVRHADALEAALREEPPPRSVHQAAVARTLAAAARGGHAPTLKAELERLLEEQARTFYPFCKAALERALAALGAS